MGSIQPPWCCVTGHKRVEWPIIAHCVFKYSLSIDVLTGRPRLPCCSIGNPPLSHMCDTNPGWPRRGARTLHKCSTTVVTNFNICRVVRDRPVFRWSLATPPHRLIPPKAHIFFYFESSPNICIIRTVCRKKTASIGQRPRNYIWTQFPAARGQGIAMTPVTKNY